MELHAPRAPVDGRRPPYDELTRCRGADAEDAVKGGWQCPRPPLGRLKATGLIVQGAAGGRESVMIPAGIRRLLKSIGAFSAN